MATNIDCRDDVPAPKSIMSNALEPGELKFYATYKGKRVNDGDYWLPDVPGCQNAGQHLCCPVRISSLGIHYTWRTQNPDDHIEHTDGRTYYGSWDVESVQAENVLLFLIAPTEENSSHEQ